MSYFILFLFFFPFCTDKICLAGLLTVACGLPPDGSMHVAPWWVLYCPIPTIQYPRQAANDAFNDPSWDRIVIPEQLMPGLSTR